MKLKTKKPIPFQFVLDELESLGPMTRPMFGCTSVYLGEKIVLILRDREDYPEDNGVWIATTSEHHASLKQVFSSMRSIGLLGGKITGWQNLPASAPDFEEAALRACALVAEGDPRIGKVPKAKKAARKRAPR